MKKHSWAGVLCLLLCLLLASCGAGASSAEPTPVPTPTATPEPTAPEGTVFTGVTFEADDMQPVDVWKSLTSVGLTECTGSHDAALMQFTRGGKVGLVGYDGVIAADANYSQIGLFGGAYYLLYADGTCDVYENGALREGGDLSVYTGTLTDGDYSGAYYWDINLGKLRHGLADKPTDAPADTAVPVVIREECIREGADNTYIGKGGYGLANLEKRLVKPVYPGVMAVSEPESPSCVAGGAVAFQTESGYIFYSAEGKTLTPEDLQACWVPAAAVGQAGTEAFPYHFSDGSLCAYHDGAFGYIALDGTALTAQAFEKARPAHEGQAFVQMKGDTLWRVIEFK